MTDGATGEVGFRHESHPLVAEAVAGDGGDETLAIVDAAARERVPIGVGGRPAPAPVASPFRYPVDLALSVRTARVEFPTGPFAVLRRAEDGEQLARLDGPRPGTETVPGGTYVLEVSAAVKCYCRLRGPLSVERSDGHLAVAADGDRVVVLGARSYHDRPAATVTVPETPRAAMRAVSTFGAALKTHSPERSWPTLRGHPPRLERGGELSVPEGLEAPATGVTVGVPPEWRYVLPVAPLAYYLGATVEPAADPQVRTATGGRHALGEAGDPDAVADAVRRVLQRALLLDCVVRREGIYEMPLHERRALLGDGGPAASADGGAVTRSGVVEPAGVDGAAPLSGLDTAALYDADPAERLDAYLSVPFEDLAPFVPEWSSVTRVPAGPAAVESLPFLVDGLGLVRVREDPGTDRTTGGADGPGAAGGRVAPPGGDASGALSAGGDLPPVAEDVSTLLGSVADGNPASGPPTSRSVAGPADPDAPSPGSVHGPEAGGPDGPGPDPGDGGAVGGDRRTGPSTTAGDSARSVLDRATLGGPPAPGRTVAVPAAHGNALAADPSETVDVDLVLGDARMYRELDEVREVYRGGDRTDLPFDVQVHVGPDRECLSDLLAADREFLHYVGHVDREGLRCPDGSLDVRGLDDVGTEAFLLNGCASYPQGRALVEAGAVAGVATVEAVPDVSAASVGATIARLLNAGFPVRAAMRVCELVRPFPSRYVAVGDAGHVLNGGGRDPRLYYLRRAGTGGADRPDAPPYRLWYRSFPSGRTGLGSVQAPCIDAVERNFLTSGWSPPIALSEGDLAAFLSMPADVPVLLDVGPGDAGDGPPTGTDRSGPTLHWKDEVAPKVALTMLRGRGP